MLSSSLLVWPSWTARPAACVQTLFGRKLRQSPVDIFANDICHHPACIQVPLHVLWICRPSGRFTCEWRCFAGVNTDEMANETCVVLHESFMLEHSSFTSSPKMQPHPYTRILRLEVLAPLVRFTLGGVPSCKVGTGSVMGYLNCFTSKLHVFFWVE